LIKGSLRGGRTLAVLERLLEMEQVSAMTKYTSLAVHNWSRELTTEAEVIALNSAEGPRACVLRRTFFEGTAFSVRKLLIDVQEVGEVSAIGFNREGAMHWEEKDREVLSCFVFDVNCDRYI
jgi:hypothetical protein